MAIFDVFNGDADGICALHQLRLANPVSSTLVTGVKRDIALLKQVDAKAGDEVTVLDISLDKNRDALIRVLESGASVSYFDHHFAGEIPEHARLDVNIDTDANACTSLSAIAAPLAPRPPRARFGPSAICTRRLLRLSIEPSAH